MVSADTQTFSSKPRTITDKYRPSQDNPSDEHYYANIHFDKRVYRGSNYSKQQPGTTGPSQNVSQNVSQSMSHMSNINNSQNLKKRSLLLKEKKVDPFALEVPKPERLPIDLLSHLVEKSTNKQHNSQKTQTDPFKELSTSQSVKSQKNNNNTNNTFIPKKTGVDVTTHISEGDLFNFDLEVEPLLNVLVSKTLEQSHLEMEEEVEMNGYKEYKQKWCDTRCNVDKKDIDAMVKEEELRYEYSLKCKNDKKLLNYDRVKEKLICRDSSRIFNDKIFKNALISLQNDHGLMKEGSNTNSNGSFKSICTEFVPFLFSEVCKKLHHEDKLNERLISELCRNIVVEKICLKEKSKREYEEKEKEKKKKILEKQKAEEEELLRLKSEEEKKAQEEGDGGEGEE